MGWPGLVILLISTSQVARVTGVITFLLPEIISFKRGKVYFGSQF
jgi:hypothetical protein